MTRTCADRHVAVRFGRKVPGWLVTAGFVLAGTAYGQSPRQLDYKLLAVKAMVTDAGILRVEERHFLVMTGDWNGAERYFRLRGNQRVTIDRVGRWNPETRSEVPMVRGDLESVNSWAFTGQNFRFRARLPSDPPFQQTVVAYRIQYQLAGALEQDREDGPFQLDHDFAFTDRDGPIEEFTLEIDLGSDWKPDGAFESSYEATGIAPGKGFRVQASLNYLGEEALAAAVVRPPGGLPVWSGKVVAAFLIAFLAAALWCLRSLQPERWSTVNLSDGSGEKDKVAAEEIRDLRGRWSPEQTAMLWRCGKNGAEGQALLADLIARKKIEVREVEVEGRSDRSTIEPQLHLHGGRRQLNEAAKVLIDALFLGRREISLAEIKRHYSATGFDLSKLIRPVVEPETRVQVEAQFEAPFDNDGLRRKLGLICVVLAAAAVALCGLELWLGPNLRTAAVRDVFFMWMVALLLPWPAFAIAGFGAKRALGLVPWALGTAALALVPLVLLGFQDIDFVGPWALGARVALGALIVVFLIRRLSSRFGTGFVRASHELVRLRNGLADRVSEGGEGIDGRLVPYAVAFGLDSRGSEWSAVQGPARQSDPRFRLYPEAVTSAGHRSSGEAGGGGTFGGAGAGASWAAVSGFSSVAAPVSRPGSSGSSGSSSGGGGGGGW